MTAAAVPIRVTPLVRHGAVALKLENLQTTGSFKLRGAARKLASLTSAERAAGVVTASAGNHGAGVALVGRALGIAATVYVPEHTPANKRQRIAELGAEVIVAGDGYDESERLAIAAAARDARTYVSAYEDDHVRAGNGGDLGRELCGQDAAIARVIAPVGGGGLISGLAAELCPRGIEVIGAQPERNCAMAASLRAGRWLADYRGEPTLAEGCEGGVGPRCYEIASRWVGPIALVSELAIRRAIAHLYREAGQIAEGAGAVAMAAVLEGVVAPAASGTTVVVITGGNIEPSLLDEILAGSV